MAEEQEYIIYANGMRVHKDLSIKHSSRSTEKQIKEEDLTLLRKKGLVWTIAKSKQEPKGDNLDNAPLGKPMQPSVKNEPTPKSDSPMNYLRIDLPKDFLMRKEKKTYFHRFNEGMFVFYIGTRKKFLVDHKTSRNLVVLLGFRKSGFQEEIPTYPH